MEFNKTYNIKTETQLNSLIEQAKDYYLDGGKQPLFFNEFNHLISLDTDNRKKRENRILIAEYTWIDKTIKEIDQEEKQTQQNVDYKTDIQKWRNEKVKPWSFTALAEFIDKPAIRELEFDLSSIQIQERKQLRTAILVYHNQEVYKTDEELKASRPSAPTYSTEQQTQLLYPE